MHTIAGLNVKPRRPVRIRGHLPDDMAALKLLRLGFNQVAKKRNRRPQDLKRCFMTAFQRPASKPWPGPPGGMVDAADLKSAARKGVGVRVPRWAGFGLANPAPKHDFPLMASPRVTIWFDGACPLCLREIALMRRLDKQGAIAFIDATSVDASCPIDPALLLQRFHAREGDGPLLHGAAAFAAMWRAIPLLYPLGLAARLPPLLWVMEGAYRAFLRLRPRLQAWAR